MKGKILLFGIILMFASVVSAESTGQPDLAVLDIIIEPEQPIFGETTTVTVILANLGDAESAYSASISISYPNGGGTGHGFAPSPDNPLEPGEDLSFSVDFIPNKPGIYEIEAGISPTGDDSDLSNNVKIETFKVKKLFSKINRRVAF